jgi:DNA ligase-1
MPASWIHKMNESNSRLHKERVIEQALAARTLGDKSAEWFLFGAFAAYSPFLTYNIKKVPVTEGLTDRENPWIAWRTLLSDLNDRKLTGNDAIFAVESMSKRFDSDEWNNFCAPVIQKDLRVGATLKTFNKYLGNTDLKIPVFECQLATDSAKQEKKMTSDKILQRKLDGVRVLVICVHGTVAIYSRNGKQFENFNHIIPQLQRVMPVIQNAMSTPNFVLDGEMMSDDFQTLMRQAHRKYNADASDSRFHIFDIINYGGFMQGVSRVKQSSRTDMLHALRVRIEEEPNLVVEPFLRVDLNTGEGIDVMHRYADECIAQGYEGIMIKDAGAPYECKRTTHWLKWKPNITVDLKVIAVEEGTGRNVGRLGALVCEGVDDGRTIKTNVGSGLTDSDRDSFWDSRNDIIGTIAEVRADAVTQNQDGSYSLRFPRFVRFRGFTKGEKL